MDAIAETGTLPPSQDPSDWIPGDELTPLEEKMCACAAAGEWLSLGEGPFELAEMQAWAAGRTVRASVLRHLLIDEHWPADAKGARLRGARISGTLDFEAATLRRPLWLDGCYLDAAVPVGLDYAITRSLTLTRCHLAGIKGNVLTSSGLTLQGSTFTGPVSLRDASIAAVLSFRGTHLTGADQDGDALVADRIKVGGDIFLDGGLTAEGTISLRSARIFGSARLGLARPAGGVTALDAAGMQITGSLLWAPEEQVAGPVGLEGVIVGQLEDSWTPGDQRANGSWPSGGQLRLDGFTYGRIGGSQPATVQQRLAWIRGQYKRDAAGHWAGFTTQPYEQLAAVYRQGGQDREARTIGIARRSDLRRYGNLTWYRRVGNWLMDKTIKYGYQTWRAAAGLAAVYVAVLVLSVIAQHHGLITPIGNIFGLRPVPAATVCTADYPCFYPAGYAIDTVIPIINVHQADYWGPAGQAPWGWVWVAGTWLATGLGWALATLLVTGYTGLARQQ